MSDLTLEIRRTLPASRQRVFAAWTTPALLMKWWGPEGIECPGAEVDLRVGGNYRIGNRTEDGEELWIEGTFEEVEAPALLVYTWSMDPAEPAKERVRVSFIDKGEETEVVIVHEHLSSQSIHDEHRAGWLGCLDGLAALLTG